MEKSENIKILKIDFNIKPSEEVEKRVFFLNSDLTKISYREKFGFFYRFDFKAIFDYLGEKEEFPSTIYIFNGKPIDGDLSEYVLLDGDESDIQLPDYKNAYFVAKEELKTIVQEKTNSISKILSLNLEKEKNKIEKNFVLETQVFQKKLSEIAEKLMEYAKKGEVEKIAEQKKELDLVKQKSNFAELEKDKLRAMQLEGQKHILNVEKKLEKTTIICYPIYVVTAEIKKEGERRFFTFEFDPMSKDINGLICESCSNKMRKVVMCTSGHAVCQKCSVECQSCHKIYCKKCVKYSCDFCSKKICKNCAVRCFRCSKLVCKNHTRKEKISGHSYCNNCLKKCPHCKELKDPFIFKVSKKTNEEICEDCYRNENQKNVLKGVFE